MSHSLLFQALLAYWQQKLLLTLCREETKKRARDGNVEILSSDQELVQASDYILSIVPPKDALVSSINAVITLDRLTLYLGYSRAYF